MKQCLRIQLLMALCLLLIPLAGYSQSASQQGTTPAPYPKLQSTGNAEADRANHEKAVQAWKEQERRRVERLQSDPAQKNVSNKPSQVKALRVAQKEAGVKVEPVAKRASAVREITIIDLPGFPKYIVTGNPSLDEKNYQEAKAKWIDENSAAYKKYVEEHSKKSGKLTRQNPVGQK